MKIKLSEIAKYLSADFVGKDVYIDKIVTDSREIKKGNLFIAISGQKYDGHDYIEDSINNGAVAIICERLDNLSGHEIPYILINDSVLSLGDIAENYKMKLGDPYTIGITGTNGKTTVTKLTASILKENYKISTTLGNFNNQIGLPLSILNTKINENIEKCIYELGASKLNDIKYLTRICKPDCVTLLNVSEAHIESFGNMENLIKAKEEIFSHPKTSHIVLNKDDELFSKWKKINNHRKISTISIKNSADYYIKSEDDNHLYISSTLGEFCLRKNKIKNILHINILFSIALSIEAGSSIDAVISGIESFSGIEGRFYEFYSKDKSKIIDDSYNANPQSMKSAIERLATFKNTRIFVMGDMGELGDNAYKHHTSIFKLVKELGIEYLFYMGNYKEEARTIFGKNCYTFDDIFILIDSLRKIAIQDTSVLIKASRYMNFDIIARELK